MSLTPLWVQFFADHGVPAVHWSEVGAPNAKDHQIMTYAAFHGFIVFTHDLDFGALLAGNRATQPSVLQVRGQNVFPCAIGSAALHSLREAGSHLAEDALVTVDLNRRRIRLLPF